LDARKIKEGREADTVTAQQMSANGLFENAVYHVTFTFVFHAFNPNHSITLE
jgi:hypothetical protein|tara:strand:+ start:65 stop:220 length:156 start_codon:yes stop_codon:yes gene_type:complete